MTTEQCTATVRQTGRFLAEYSALLMGSGATCIRIEKNVTRIARAYGKQVEISIMPRHLQLTISEAGSGGDCLTLNTSVAAVPICTGTITRLSELSWNIADHGLTLDEATARLNGIAADRDSRSECGVALTVALANASFCRLFGGDWVAMAVVAAATFAGFMLRQSLLRHGMDVRAVFLVCAFVSTVIASGDRLFGLGSTGDIAIATGVLYLVPGIPLLNSFSDMLYRHYLCALGRFADAAVLICCLSAGLCLGMFAMNTGMF